MQVDDDWYGSVFYFEDDFYFIFGQSRNVNQDFDNEYSVNIMFYLGNKLSFVNSVEYDYCY